jgi:hypothetical protein
MISIAKAAADPAGHYSRPDVTRLLFNPAPANRVEYISPAPGPTESLKDMEKLQTEAEQQKAALREMA